MAKKTYDAGNLESVYANLNRGAEVAQEEQEIDDVYDASKTQGKKGKQLARVNMGFSDSNYEFMKVMAGLYGMSITKYCNHLIEEERKRSADVFQKAKDFQNELRGGK